MFLPFVVCCVARMSEALVQIFRYVAMERLCIWWAAPQTTLMDAEVNEKSLLCNAKWIFFNSATHHNHVICSRWNFVDLFFFCFFFIKLFMDRRIFIMEVFVLLLLWIFIIFWSRFFYEIRLFSDDSFFDFYWSHFQIANNHQYSVSNTNHSPQIVAKQ